MDGRRRRRSRSRGRSRERDRDRGGGGGGGGSRDHHRTRPPARRSRSRERSRNGDRERGGGGASDRRSQEPGQSAASRAPQPSAERADAATACAALSQANLRLLFVSFEDMQALALVEMLLRDYNRQRKDGPPLSVVKGCLVRYKHGDRYHLGAITRFTLHEDEDDEPLIMVLGHDPSVPYFTLFASGISSTNPLVEPLWSEGGQDELAELQQRMQAARKTLTLQQAAEAAVRRRAVLQWMERYEGEKDLSEFLPKLLPELTDAEEIARVARRLEAAPASPPPAASSPRGRDRERERRRGSPDRQRPQRQSSPDRQRPQRQPSPDRQRPQQQRSPDRQRQARRASPERRGHDMTQRREEQRPRPKQQPEQEHNLRQQSERRHQQHHHQHVPAAAPQPAHAPTAAQQQQQQQRHGVPSVTIDAAAMPSMPVSATTGSHPAAAAADLPLPPHLMPAAAQVPQQLAGGVLAPDVGSAASHAAFALSMQQQQQQQQQPGPVPMHRVAPSNVGAKQAADSQPAAAAAAAAATSEAELQAARQAARTGLAKTSSAGGKSAGGALEARPPPPTQQQPSSSQQASPSAVDQAQSTAAAAAAAASKRKRAPIQWEPQPSQEGDRALEAPANRAHKAQQAAAAAAVADDAGHRSKVQKVASSGREEPKTKPKSAAAAAVKTMRITVHNDRASPAPSEEGELRAEARPRPAPAERSRLAAPGPPSGSDLDLPPGFGDGGGAAHPFRAASFGGGGGRLTVSVAAPPAEAEPYAGGGSLASRFGSLQAQHPLLHGEPAPALQQPMLFSVGSGAPAAQLSPQPPAALGSRFDAAAAAFGHQLPSEQALAAAAAALQQQQQQLYLSPDQLAAVAAATAQQQQPPPYQQLSYQPTAALAPLGAHGGFAMPDAAMAEEGRQVSREASGSMGDGRRQVQVGGSSGSREGKSSRLRSWDPMLEWELQAHQLLQDHAGGIKMGRLPRMPPCWRDTISALYAYVSRRKQLFVVKPSADGVRESAMVLPAKGARVFLAWKRRLLEAVAVLRPRTTLRELLKAAPPPSNLRPDLRSELDREPLAFIDKYFGGEVAVGRSQDEPGEWRLELRPFPPQPNLPRVQPPFKNECYHWAANRPCKHGDRCAFVHAAPRLFDR